MATINPSIVTTSVDLQNLYTIDYPLTGVPQYNTVGSQVVVLFDNTDIEEGTDIAVDTATGEITVQANFTYSFSAIAYSNAPTTAPASAAVVPTYRWYNETTGNFVGNPVPIGIPVVHIVTPGEETVYTLKVIAPNGINWTYPSTITLAQATIQVVSGFVE